MLCILCRYYIRTVSTYNMLHVYNPSLLLPEQDLACGASIQVELTLETEGSIKDSQMSQLVR